MTREQMMDNVMRKLGFEVVTTIEFCTLADNPNYSEQFIKIVYESIMRRSPFSED